MKKFIKKKWHSIPIGILTVVILFILAAGGAVYAYSAWSGTAEVTVDECLTISNTTGDDGDYSGSPPSWSVSLYPGESKTLKVNIHNDSSVAINVLLTATESYTSIDASWNPGAPSVGAGSDVVSTLTVSADPSATPGIYSVDLDISR